MLFDVYGDTAVFQWVGWVIVFVGLILINEFARRTKAGGIVCFLVIPAILTIYFIAISVSAAAGAQWALDNPTYTDMNSWFHYAKLYAATIGCIGFMALKYRWGKIGKSHWFKAFPFVIVAINILIAVVSDFESAVRAFGTTWVSTEGVTLYGGWHNVFNGIAGLINIFCMTGWFGIYISKKRLRPVELLLHLQLPAYAFLVLRPGAAFGPHRRQCALEQGRLDPEPRLHACHLVHVLPGRPHVRQRLHLRRQLREQPEHQPRGLHHRASGEHCRSRLHRIPR